VLEHTPEIAFLKRMVLQKDYRKRGLGKQLLDTAIDFAKKCGYKKLYAGTVEKNPNAISFYKHLGFTLCDDVPIGITADSNSICLEKELESLAK